MKTTFRNVTATTHADYYQVNKLVIIVVLGTKALCGRISELVIGICDGFSTVEVFLQVR